MSSLRRPPGPVRQLSLQQPPRRQQVRRQRSAEDEKPLAVFANPIRTRVQCSDGKNEPDRPRVRVAWDEEGGKSTNGVSLIARQIPGKPRPPTAKGKPTTRPLIGEKASILYSRQELAERLRLAWKQREEQKGNIDIFLAQNAVEDRYDSRPSSCATSRALPLEESSPVLVSESAIDKGPKSVSEERLLNPRLPMKEGNETVAGGSSFSEDYVSFIEERMKEDLTVVNGVEETFVVFDEEGDKILDEEICKDKKRDVIKEIQANAKTRRANFSNPTNRITSSGSVGVSMGSTDRREKVTGRDQPLLVAMDKTRRTNSAPPQRRRVATNVEAGRTRVSIVIDTSTIGSDVRHTKQPETSATTEVVLKAAIPSRAIKSAPVKRRAKSGKRRGNSGARILEGDEEDERTDGGNRRSGGRGKTMQSKPTDVVTMVSLVSSADSDSEIDQNSPRDDKLIHELRNKLPTTPIIKTSGSSPAIAVFRKPVKCVSFQQESFDLDKDDDRVRSFGGFFGQQRFPVVCRGNGSALPTPEEATSWRSDDPLLSVMNRCEAEEHQDDLVAPITDREKRCLAVPIGDAIRDKKRRLLRTRSTPPRPTVDERLLSVTTPEIRLIPRIRDQESTNEKTLTVPCSTDVPSIAKVEARSSETEIGTEIEPEFGLASSEPQFQTRKERECWHLYRRMCDKGVYVSFDTVLRGMLTPTEYRLRQKESAGDCSKEPAELVDPGKEG